MSKAPSIHACEVCGTREGVKLVLINGLSQLTGRAHPICRECSGHIGPMDDEKWERIESANAVDGAS